ncbi:MAG TPA: STAS domain-containing protein [Planococcus sp. (in: firmicutes)]|nr:STAS domain-containing protein [Planococcus sp. (in: firmicutes)]
MDKEKSIDELKDMVRYYEKLIRNMAAPIIPSIVPNIVLIPITGIIFRDRFQAIRTNVLAYAETNREVECAIFDFTGVQLEDIEAYDYNELASELAQINSTLKLMGLRPIYAGFTPSFVKEIVNAGIQVELESFTTFRVALRQILSERGQKSISF